MPPISAERKSKCQEPHRALELSAAPFTVSSSESGVIDIRAKLLDVKMERIVTPVVAVKETSTYCTFKSPPLLKNVLLFNT